MFFVEIYTPRRSFGNSSAYGVVNSIDLVNTFEGDNKDGEFHTKEL
jgi:hypothetical protein